MVSFTAEGELKPLRGPAAMLAKAGHADLVRIDGYDPLGIGKRDLEVHRLPLGKWCKRACHSHHEAVDVDGLPRRMQSSGLSTGQIKQLIYEELQTMAIADRHLQLPSHRVADRPMSTIEDILGGPKDER